MNETKKNGRDEKRMRTWKWQERGKGTEVTERRGDKNVCGLNCQGRQRGTEEVAEETKAGWRPLPQGTSLQAKDTSGCGFQGFGGRALAKTNTFPTLQQILKVPLLERIPPS